VFADEKGSTRDLKTRDVISIPVSFPAEVPGFHLLPYNRGLRFFKEAGTVEMK
jgi:hypothetical protein